jgi:hypothetical protein
MAFHGLVHLPLISFSSGFHVCGCLDFTLPSTFNLGIRDAGMPCHHLNFLGVDGSITGVWPYPTWWRRMREKFWAFWGYSNVGLRLSKSAPVLHPSKSSLDCCLPLLLGLSFRDAGMPCQHLYTLGSYGSVLAGGVATHQLQFQAPMDDFRYLAFTQPNTLYLGTGGLVCLSHFLLSSLIDEDEERVRL